MNLTNVQLQVKIARSFITAMMASIFFSNFLFSFLPYLRYKQFCNYAWCGVLAKHMFAGRQFCALELRSGELFAYTMVMAAVETTKSDD